MTKKLDFFVSLRSIRSCPSQPSSASQLAKDPPEILAPASTPKSKMSSRRSGHSGVHSSSAVAIVEAHSPAASASSSSAHHRVSSRHQKQTSQQHFDMTQIQHSISVLASEGELQKSPRTRLVSSGVVVGGVAATNGNGSATGVKDDPTVKKERIKNLWGKVGKQGMLQAAAARQPAMTSSSVPLPSQLQPQPASHAKWDQVLNPLLQKQERVIYGADPAAIYLNATVGGEAGGGSGFYGQPGNATMECDCGDDSCPQCNLMLNMGSNGPAW